MLLIVWMNWFEFSLIFDEKKFEKGRVHVKVMVFLWPVFIFCTVNLLDLSLS